MALPSSTWSDTEPLPRSTSDSTRPRMRARSRPGPMAVSRTSLRSCSLIRTPSTDSSAWPSPGVRRASEDPTRSPVAAGLQDPLPRCSSTTPLLSTRTAPGGGPASGSVASPRGVGGGGAGGGALLVHLQPYRAKARPSRATPRSMDTHIRAPGTVGQRRRGGYRAARGEVVAAPGGCRHPAAAARPGRAAAAGRRRVGGAAAAAVRAGCAIARARMPEDGPRRPGGPLARRPHAAFRRARRGDAPAGAAAALQGDPRRGRYGAFRRDRPPGGPGGALPDAGAEAAGEHEVVSDLGMAAYSHHVPL